MIKNILKTGKKIGLSIFSEKSGIAQLPLMVGLLIMAVAIPLAAQLVQTTTENRSKATTNCTGNIVCTGGALGTCVASGTSCTPQCPHNTSRVSGSCSVSSPTAIPTSGGCAGDGQTSYSGHPCCSGFAGVDCQGSGTFRTCTCRNVNLTPTAATRTCSVKNCTNTTPYICEEHIFTQPSSQACAPSSCSTNQDCAVTTPTIRCPGCDLNTNNCVWQTNAYVCVPKATSTTSPSSCSTVGSNCCYGDDGSGVNAYYCTGAGGSCDLATKKCGVSPTISVVPTNWPGCPAGSRCDIACIGGYETAGFGSCKYGTLQVSGRCCDYSAGNCAQIYNRKDTCSCDSDYQCASGACVNNKCVAKAPGCTSPSTCSSSCFGGAVTGGFGSCKFSNTGISGYCCDFSAGNCGQLYNRTNNCYCDSDIQCQSGSCYQNKCVASPPGCTAPSTCQTACVGGVITGAFGSCRFANTGVSGLCCDASAGNCGQLYNRKDTCYCDSDIQCQSGACYQNKCVAKAPGCAAGSTCSSSCFGGAMTGAFGSCKFSNTGISGYCCDFSAGNCGQLNNRTNDCYCDSDIQCQSGACYQNKCVAKAPGCAAGSTCSSSCFGGAQTGGFGSCKFSTTNISGYCCDFNAGNCGQLYNRTNNCYCDSDVQCASGWCVGNKCLSGAPTAAPCNGNNIGASCNGGAGRCAARQNGNNTEYYCETVCTPGQRTCEGTTLKVCNSNGGAWTSTQCGAAGCITDGPNTRCAAGTTGAPTNIPCTPAGGTMGYLGSCCAGAYQINCVGGGISRTCQCSSVAPTGSCTPGQKTCDGKTFKTCTSSGGWMGELCPAYCDPVKGCTTVAPTSRPQPTAIVGTPVPSSGVVPTEPPVGDPCAYSIQSRVHEDDTHPWAETISRAAGQTVTLGCLRDAALAKNVRILATNKTTNQEYHWDFDANTDAIVNQWTIPAAGNYEVKCTKIGGSCVGKTSNVATMTVSAPAACANECSTTFYCYQNGNDYKWFTEGNQMNGFSKVADSSCSAVTKPTFKGKNKGDANCDGSIDIYDIATWRTEYRSNPAGSYIQKDNWKADFNCDKVVDVVDASKWRSQYRLNGGN